MPHCPSQFSRLGLDKPFKLQLSLVAVDGGSGFDAVAFLLLITFSFPDSVNGRDLEKMDIIISVI